MRVALVCGSCPPGACGVGDYTRCLANALISVGIDAQVVRNEDWRVYRSFSVYRSVQRLNPDIVHIQYPSVGFASRLGPQAFALFEGCVVTLHEASGTHILRKVALLPFSIRPKHLIFPSEFERRFATRWAPWISKISSVIPIPSNIRLAVHQGRRALDEIVNFGLIMPKKGLDDVISLGALIRSAGLSLRVRIIGTPQGHRRYFEHLQEKSSGLPIIWEHELSEEQVANRLASSSVAYLPYPDGASERRASLKAALLNGVAVITTRGPHTPSEMTDSVLFAETPQEALATACTLLDNPEERAQLVRRAAQYVHRYSWELIAELHSMVYKEILSSKVSRRNIAV